MNADIKGMVYSHQLIVIILIVFNKKAPRFARSFGWMMGLEPTTLRTTI
jgi:hypothetical protein